MPRHDDFLRTGLMIPAGVSPEQTVLVDLRRSTGPAPGMRGVHMGDNEIAALRKVDREGPQILGLAEPEFTEEDIGRARVELGCTVGRYGFQASILEDDDVPFKMKEPGFAYLDKVIGYAERCGLALILDMHNAPGRRGGGDPRLWAEKVYQDRFIAIWEEILRRFHGRGGIAAYEPLNEPEPADRNFAVWNALARRITESIRKVDPTRPIIIDSIGYANARMFSGLEPTGDARTIYSFHTYSPGPYHCQKRTWIKDQNTYYYPGDVRGTHWNRAQLVEEFALPLQWARQHNARLFCGEFGCVSDVPVMTDMVFLMDKISAFQELGIGWTMYDYMQFPTDDFWKTHFDCNCYIFHVPEKKLYRFGRKIALIKFFAEPDGQVLDIAQSADEYVHTYGICRPSGWTSLLVSNKDRDATKTVHLGINGVFAGVGGQKLAMDKSVDGWRSEGAIAHENGWFRLEIPPLTIIRLELASTAAGNPWGL